MKTTLFLIQTFVIPSFIIASDTAQPNQNAYLGQIPAHLRQYSAYQNQITQAAHNNCDKSDMFQGNLHLSIAEFHSRAIQKQEQNQIAQAAHDNWNNNYDTSHLNYLLTYSPDYSDNNGKVNWVLNLYDNDKCFTKNYWDHSSEWKRVRHNIVNEIPQEQLDYPVWKDGSSIGHLALHRGEPGLFKLWLDKGALCTAITDKKNQWHLNYNNETILQVLCLKGLDNYPNLPELIDTVINRNRSLLFHLQNDKDSVVYTILKNQHVNDPVTLEILKIFVFHGFNFNADPRRNCLRSDRFLKPKSVEYIKNTMKGL